MPGHSKDSFVFFLCPFVHLDLNTISSRIVINIYNYRKNSLYQYIVMPTGQTAYGKKLKIAM